MANEVKWKEEPTGVAVLGSGLNSLANGSRSAAGTAYDNGSASNLYPYAWVEFVGAWGSAPTSGSTVTIWMVKRSDGTNWDAGDGSTAIPSDPPVAVLNLDARTGQRRSSQIFPLPPVEVAFLLTNNSGVAFSASGSSVNLYPCSQEIQ